MPRSNMQMEDLILSEHIILIYMIYSSQSPIGRRRALHFGCSKSPRRNLW